MGILDQEQMLHAVDIHVANEKIVVVLILLVVLRIGR